MIFNTFTGDRVRRYFTTRSDYTFGLTSRQFRVRESFSKTRNQTPVAKLSNVVENFLAFFSKKKTRTTKFIVTLCDVPVFVHVSKVTYGCFIPTLIAAG